MKAVNLLPREAQRSFGTLRGLGAGTTALLGVLALACVLVVAYVVLANNLTSKKGELAQVQAQTAAAEKQVAELKTYADLEQARVALMDRVRTLAATRYDWPQALGRIARAVPADSLLSDVNGTAASEAGSGPTVSITGCTPSHQGVARLIDRLRAVKGVAGVALQSTKVAREGGGGECPKPEQFQLSVELAAPTAASLATPTPAPNAAPAGGS